MDGLEVIKVKDKRKEEVYLSILSTGGVYNDATVDTKTSAYTALDYDLFLPRSTYNSDKSVPIIFDSGGTHAVTPFKEDSIGEITTVRKLMNGLGATAEVIGEGTVL